MIHIRLIGLQPAQLIQFVELQITELFLAPSSVLKLATLVAIANLIRV